MKRQVASREQKAAQWVRLPVGLLLEKRLAWLKVESPSAFPAQSARLAMPQVAAQLRAPPRIFQRQEQQRKWQVQQKVPQVS